MVQGEAVPLHRCLLTARSEYFRDMLQSRWHSRNKVIINKDMVSDGLCIIPKWRYYVQKCNTHNVTLVLVTLPAWVAFCSIVTRWSRVLLFDGWIKYNIKYSCPLIFTTGHTRCIPFGDEIYLHRPLWVSGGAGGALHTYRGQLQTAQLQTHVGGCCEEGTSTTWVLPSFCVVFFLHSIHFYCSRSCPTLYRLPAVV